MAETERQSRWYDTTRVIWGLFVIIGFLVGWIIKDQATTIQDHEKRLNRLDAEIAVTADRLKTIADDIKEIKASVKKGN